MWVSGLLTFCIGAEMFASMFTVVKKMVDDPLRGRYYVLRLIFDGRRGNIRWRRPPGTPLTTASQIGFIDLCPEVLRGRRVSFYGGDVPVFYYHLRIP